MSCSARWPAVPAKPRFPSRQSRNRSWARRRSCPRGSPTCSPIVSSSSIWCATLRKSPREGPTRRSHSSQTRMYSSCNRRPLTSPTSTTQASSPTGKTRSNQRRPSNAVERSMPACVPTATERLTPQARCRRRCGLRMESSRWAVIRTRCTARSRTAPA